MVRIRIMIRISDIVSLGVRVDGWVSNTRYIAGTSMQGCVRLGMGVGVGILSLGWRMSRLSQHTRSMLVTALSCSFNSVTYLQHCDLQFCIKVHTTAHTNNTLKSNG